MYACKYISVMHSVNDRAVCTCMEEIIRNCSCKGMNAVFNLLLAFDLPMK